MQSNGQPQVNNVHKQIIGACWIILGALIISPLAMKLDNVNKQIVLPGILFGLIYVASGFVLMANLKKSPWICLPCAVVSLFSFPFGTPIGIYYLWYYFNYEKLK